MDESDDTTRAVDAVVMASRTVVAVAARSLGAAGEETTLAQYRMLVVLASRGPQRLVDLAETLGVAASTAGRMCDRLARKRLVSKHRMRADRRTVKVAVTSAGRRVVDEATARRREVVAEIMSRLPVQTQRAIAETFVAFALAAGEVPDDRWPIEAADLAGGLER